jgi:hypothetical protein
MITNSEENNVITRRVLRSQLSLRNTNIDASCCAVDSALPVKKPARICSKKSPKEVINHSLDYHDYYKHDVNLNKYKIVDLKAVAKYNRLHVTGNKPTLTKRILEHFTCNKSSTVIQKNLRRFFVNRSFQLRGPAFKNRSICVNETDFYTMEPLNEIPFQEFFSYTDDSNFTYGFNICSLLSLLKRKGRSIVNPYNRAKIPETAIGDIIRLYIYGLILFPQNVNPEDLVLTTRNIFIQPVNFMLLSRGYYYGFPRRIKSPPMPPDNATPPVMDVSDTCGNGLNNTVIPPLFRPLLQSLDESENGRTSADASYNDYYANTSTTEHDRPTPVVSDESNAMVNSRRAMEYVMHIDRTTSRLQELRTKPIQTRIQEIFMEMDQLGNYTDATWFSSLGKRQLFVFYGHLFDMWRFRGRLSAEVKMKICPLGDPFHRVMPIRMRMDEVSDEQLRYGCVTVMENMVFTAFDVEDRKIGTLYVLLSLTMVSNSARNNLLWLYESVGYN